MSEETNRLRLGAIAKARELCGCTRCQGGYDIGGRTLAMPAKANGSAERPSSCVASVLLPDLLREMSTPREQVADPRGPRLRTSSVSDLATDLVGVLTVDGLIELRKALGHKLGLVPAPSAKEIVLALADNLMLVCDHVGDAGRAVERAAKLVGIEMPVHWGEGALINADAEGWRLWMEARKAPSLSELEAR